MSLSIHFAYVRAHLKEIAGIVLDPAKDYLVKNRLGSLAGELGYEDLEALLAALLKEPKSGPLHHRAIDALTINETSFFRDHHPFELLKDRVLPRLIEANAASKSLRIWSAASSTGQEIYSLAMLLDEKFPQLRNWNVRLLATDISDRVLRQAKEGVYTDFEVRRGLRPETKERYFLPQGDQWQLKKEIRDRVTFQRMNLNEDWQLRERFDIILMRNVLIYFDIQQKKAILKKAKEHLDKRGCLILGASETTYYIDDDWVGENVNSSSIYHPRVTGPSPHAGEESHRSSLLAPLSTYGSCAIP